MQYRASSFPRWAEYLVIVAILGTLAALCFPWTADFPALSRKHLSKSKLRQIAMAMVVYREENDMHWPAISPVGALPRFGSEAETLGAFEVLVAFSQGDTPARLFHSPVDENVPLITIPPTATGTAWIGQRASYHYDWSVPSQTMTTWRVLVGDRSPELWGGTGINVVLGDGSATWLKATSATCAIYPDANNDNVLAVEPEDYSAPGVDMLRIGLGSTTRSALR